MGVNEKMTAIADAIRDKTGKTDALSLDTMATEIPNVFEEGKKAQNKDFWETYLADVMNGDYANYLFAGSCWNNETFFPPPVKIVPKSNMASMFCYFAWGHPPYIDLAQRLEECGSELDYSQSTQAPTQMFTYCWVTRLPKLNFSQVLYNFDRVFNHADYLETIDELVLPDVAKTFNQVFANCSRLANIKVSGSIQRSIDFSACPLTPESMKSIIDTLADYSTTDTGTYTVSFNSTCWDALEADSTAPDGGTWRNYVDSKGWLT